MGKNREVKDKDSDEATPYTAKDLFGLIFYLAIIFVIIFCIIKFVGQRTIVDGSSMETTLQNGDNLIIDKISYRFKDPKRYDIIVFPYKYQKNTDYIKRIIGLPGETVYIDSNGKIYINGVVLEEDYGAAKIEDAGMASSPITLGDDEYFVMGDNRNHSEDSRSSDVGLIKKSDIIGRAWVRIYPFNRICTLGPKHHGSFTVKSYE